MSCDWEMARLFLVGADRVTKVPISATDILAQRISSIKKNNMTFEEILDPR